MTILKIDKPQVLEMINSLFSKRDDTKNKSDFGQGVVVGGSSNYVGAPQFSTDACAKIIASTGRCAMLSGLGTSVLAIPDFLVSSLYQNVRYSAIYPLQSDGNHIVFNKQDFERLSKKANAFAIGMGMSDGEADKIADYLLNNTKCKLIIDADALIKTTNFDFCGRAILTPHVGEMSKISGIGADEILMNPEKVCLEYAKKHNAIVVLKDYETCISDGEKIYKFHFGNAKLAKGGSGDVLSGIILGIVGFSENLLLSAIAGCYILGECAEKSEVNEFSHTPDDIINEIPAVIDGIINFN